MAVCLVTGGAGFLGSHLVAALLERGRRVRVFDHQAARPADLEWASDRIDWVLGDLLNLKTVRQATDGVDTVFHLAPPVGPNLPRPGDSAFFDDGALQVLIAARDSLVQRVVYASSLRVYGHAPWAPLSESAPAYPVSDYAVAKLSGEQDCASFTHMYGLETVRLRYSNLFGPRRPASRSACGLVARLVTTLFEAQRPVLPEDGLQPQDLLYVDDAVQAALLAAEAPHVSGQVFNIGCGTPVTPLELAIRLGALTGGAPPPVFGGPPDPFEFNNLADITRARTKLRFRPEVDLGTALARCVECYRDDPSDKRERRRILNGS